MSIPLHSYRLALFGRLSDPTVDTPVIEDVFGSIGYPKNVPTPLVFEEVLNDPGTLEFEVPIDHALVTRANFALRKAEVYLYRDEDDDPDPVWGGRLWVADVRDWTVRFKAYGWSYDLQKREVEDDYASTADSPLDLYRIVHDLLDNTQTSDDLGITEYEDYTSVTSGITRAITVCAEERAKVLDVIDDLATGFDYAINPLKVLRLYAHRGSTTPVTTLDAASNVSSFSYTEDATVTATEVAGIGAKGDCAVPQVYVTQDAGAIAEFGLLQESVSPDHPEDQDAVEDEADELLRTLSVPRLQPEVSTGSALNDYLASPDVLDPAALDFYDIEVGDVVTLEASRGAAGGYGQFSDDFRVLMRRVEVGAPGNEFITYGLDQVTP